MFFVPESRIEAWIEEDLHLMDLTVDALGIEDRPGCVECFPKEDCVIAGVEEAARIFRAVGALAEEVRPSGSRLPAGTVCLRAEGTAGRLHAVYKAAQNVMEYASGIATRTAGVVRNARAASPSVEVAVTRKHFPGTKHLSVRAALAGGATVHRLGLSESILVFDQHRAFLDEAEFLSAIPRMAARFPERRIMAEAGSVEEAVRFAEAGVQVIQCERFSPDALRECVERVRRIQPGVRISAAGGIDADNAADYAAAGADVLVSSWVYFGRPQDVKMKFSAARARF